MDKKNILVTGALGYIGSKLIRAYAERDDVEKVVMFDNLSTQRYCSMFNLPKNIPYQFIQGDIRDRKKVEEAVKGADIVVHLAALTDAPSTFAVPYDTWDINLHGTQHVLDASIRNGVKRFIFPSTTSVYGESEGIVSESDPIEKLKPSSPYAESKLEAERMVVDANGKNGLETIALRNGTVFGTSIGVRFSTAINTFVYQASMGKPLTIWDTALHSKRPYLGINDAVSAWQFVEEKGQPGEVYNVVTQNFNMQEVLEVIKKVKPDVKVTITKSPLLNQKPYETSREKFLSLGFEYKDDLESSVRESLELFGAIKNS